MKVRFLRGLPGSGKSTYSLDYCKKNKDWVRVSRDDLRRMRGVYWLPKDEKLITKWERELVKIALSKGKNVIVDSTNLNRNKLKGFKNEVRKYCEEKNIKVEMETEEFKIGLEEAIKRDLDRRHSVGERVIKEMWDKYYKEEVKEIYNDPRLYPCIIVDIDGTLAIHNGRSPFEYEKCDTDKVNKPVAGLVRKYLYEDENAPDIIYMSGREDSCFNKTRNWLDEHGLWLNGSCELHMRKTKDNRKDYIVKKELFDYHVRGKFYVKFVIDDRPQVIRMWRELGLDVFDVGDGIEF